MSRHLIDYAAKEQPGRQRASGNNYEGTVPITRITSQSIYVNDELPKGSGLAKLAALHRRQYLNPLARLDYEDREMEVYTKISKQTQATVQKKLKARNQLADFNENEFDEDREIDDLIQFKFGKRAKSGNFTYFDSDAQEIYYPTSQSPMLPNSLTKTAKPTFKLYPELTSSISHNQSLESSILTNKIGNSSILQNSLLKAQNNIQIDKHVIPTSPTLQSKHSTKEYAFQATSPTSSLATNQPFKTLIQPTTSRQLASKTSIEVSKKQEPIKVYCTSCESFMTEVVAEDHCKVCYFDFSANWIQRKYQIIGKLEKIYRNLSQIPQTPASSRLLSILVETTYTDDSRKAEEFLNEVRSMNALTTDEAVLQKRIIVCLQEKVCLRTMGPRLGIFTKKTY